MKALKKLVAWLFTPLLDWVTTPEKVNKVQELAAENASIVVEERVKRKTGKIRPKNELQKLVLDTLTHDWKSARRVAKEIKIGANNASACLSILARKGRIESARGRVKKKELYYSAARCVCL